MMIRSEQLQAFQDDLNDAFATKLMSHLQTHHADAVSGMPDALLRSRIRYGIRRAQGHGLRRDCDIGTFVALMFELSPAFDQSPRAREILFEISAHPDDRMQNVVDLMTDEDWEQAARMGDDSSWNGN